MSSEPFAATACTDAHDERLRRLTETLPDCAMAVLEALRESEAHYRSLVESLPAVVYLVHVQAPYCPLYVSRGIEVLGWSADEWLGVPDRWTRRLHPDDRERVFDATERARDEGTTLDLEYRLVARDGTIRWFHDRASFVRDDGGRAAALQGVMLDVTERVEAELARRHLERRNAALCEQAPAFICMLQGPRHVVTMANACYRRLAGDRPLVGLALAEALPEVVGQGFLAILDRVLETGQPFEGRATPIVLRRGDALETRYADFVYQPIEEADGSRSGIFVHGVDVTDQARAARERERLVQQLRDERERMYSVLQQMPLGVVIAEAPSGRLVFANQHVARQLGNPVHAPTSLEEYCAWTGYSQDGRPVEVGECPLARAITVGAETEGWIVRYPRPGASESWLRVSAGPIRDALGRIVAGIAVSEDITAYVETQEALRRSEARFRLIMERAADVVCIIDETGTIRYASPSYERGLGYSPDQLEGTQAFAVLHPDDVPLAERTFTEVLGGVGASDPIDFRARHADGRWRTYELVARSLIGEAPGVVVTGHDVTEQRQLEAQLRQAQKMEAVGRLAGGVAHDFNNLLTVIRAHADFLFEETRGAEREDVDAIRAAAARATALTRQLLAFSRQQVLAPSVVDPNAVVRDLERMLGRLIGEDIALTLDLAPDVGSILVDAGQLEQAVTNLAVNGRDAMPDGGKLVISTSRGPLPASVAARHPEAARDAWVTIAVRDSGAGIAPEVIARIFEPFFTTKGPGHGTGLGLSMVYGVVEQSGGLVDVQSAPGRGTTFTLFFPPVAEEKPGIAEPAPAEAPRTGGETVLLVEDEEMVRAITRRILGRKGYHVLEASNGAEALELVRHPETQVDLVLTDAVMPIMGGPQLLREIRGYFPTLPVVMMSGYTDDVLVRRGALDGEAHFIQKPFSAEQLLATVRDALDGALGREA